MRKIILAFSILVSVPAMSATTHSYLAKLSPVSDSSGAGCEHSVKLTVLDTMDAQDPSEFAQDSVVMEFSDRARFEYKRSGGYRKHLSDMMAQEYVVYSEVVMGHSTITLERNSDRNYPRPNVSPGFIDMQLSIYLPETSEQIICNYSITE